jgi:hypothetical protein
VGVRAPEAQESSFLTQFSLPRERDAFEFETSVYPSAQRIGPSALANVTQVLGQDLRGDTAEDLTARMTVSGDVLSLPVRELVRARSSARGAKVVRKIRASRRWCCSCCELSRKIGV